MVEKFDEFLEEVQADIRQEKLIRLWNQYGKLMIGGIVGILILGSGYNFWHYYETNKRSQMADKLTSAQEYLSAGETDKALTVLSTLAEEGNATYRPLALFQKAGALLQMEPSAKPLEAIAIYDQLSANPKLDPLWRDLATLLSVTASIDQPTLKGEDLLVRLNALTDDKNPWRYFAREMKGLLLQRKGDASSAAEVFAALVQDNQTPSGISMRARLMVQILSTDF
jgi:hypothetical protein